MKIISILNCKGGVGKTTLTACTAQALALTGARTLVIDNDPQGNVSDLLAGETEGISLSKIYRESLGAASTKLVAAIKTTDIPDLYVIPAGKNLRQSDMRDPFHLRTCISYCKLDQAYDYILIDNSPGFDSLQKASVIASHEVLVPTELSHMSLEGVRKLEQMLKTHQGNEDLLVRIVPNFYRNTFIHNAYLEELRLACPGRVAQTTIPEDSVFDLCLRNCETLFIHKLQSMGAARYLELIQELFYLDKDELKKAIEERSRLRLMQEKRERLLKERLEKAVVKRPINEEWRVLSMNLNGNKLHDGPPVPYHL